MKVQNEKHKIISNFEIEQVISLAKNDFVKGTENAKLYGATKQESDLYCNSSQILGTNFIAISGPKEEEMAYFLDYVIKNNIKQIVALGHYAAYDDNIRQDFHDYCLAERKVDYPYHKSHYTCISLYPEEGLQPQLTSDDIVFVEPKGDKLIVHWKCDNKIVSCDWEPYDKEKNFINKLKDNNGKLFHPYLLESIRSACCISPTPIFDDEDRKIEFSYRANIKRVSGNTTLTSSGYQIYPHEVVESQVEIYRTTNDNLVTDNFSFEVTVFDLIDQCPLDLSSIEDKKILTKIQDAFLKLQQKSLNEKVLVHCKAGRGRTGHFILTLEILKHYPNLIGLKPEEISAQIKKILERIRENRPSLVQTVEQYCCAIKNAHILYQYILEKKMVFATEKSSTANNMRILGKFKSHTSSSLSSECIEDTVISQDIDTNRILS